MFEGLKATSFSMKATKPYLFNEIYSIQLAQLGRSSRFLKKPENKMKGNITAGAAITADLASITTLPKINPNDEPQNERRNAIRK